MNWIELVIDFEFCWRRYWRCRAVEPCRHLIQTGVDAAEDGDVRVESCRIGQESSRSSGPLHRVLRRLRRSSLRYTATIITP